MSVFDISNADLLLMAGEMTAQELRTVRAVLNGLKARAPQVAPEPPAPEPESVQQLALPMIRMLLKDIPRPAGFTNRQSFVLASGRYCETLAGWIERIDAGAPQAVPEPPDPEPITEGDVMQAWRMGRKQGYDEGKAAAIGAPQAAIGAPPFDHAHPDSWKYEAKCDPTARSDEPKAGGAPLGSEPETRIRQILLAHHVWESVPLAVYESLVLALASPSAGIGEPTK